MSSTWASVVPAGTVPKDTTPTTSTASLPVLARRFLAAGVGANLVTDSHVAAVAMEYQAEVHSNDTDFSRFPGLRWRNPL